MTAPSVQQLADWTRRIGDADGEAYTALYDALHPGLVRYARSLVHDEAVAFDLLQEAFARLWERRNTLDPERSVKALLFRMVYHMALKHRKRGRRTEPLGRPHERHPEAHVEPSALARLDADRTAAWLDQWIAAMPERRREVFTLSRFAELTHQEIAEVLDISPRTVNNHIVEALRYLRSRLDTVGITYTTP
jgi:RNA polymerase sigma-70 factor (ECF subfamily)